MYERATQLLEADLGDELLALDAEGGHCFGFNSVATGVWRQLVGPKSFDELHGALLAEYDVDSEQCRAELRELLDDLVERGLIRIRR
ncbi:PqqD family protein [Sphingomonas sp.]|uniref:PqqD family protein n=1 Tax=Sphingomonas sp. TaxID=28214 RepID=UPI001820094A|nr:PqqD family protein [Sphingomonas sp.]MBA3512362.1 PqqD family protein [Sphingomonas sp.]